MLRSIYTVAIIKMLAVYGLLQKIIIR